MKPHGLSSGSLVMMTTWNWMMIIFILSTSHFITLCYFNVMVQNHHKQNTDGCSYICMNNCAFLFRLRVPVGCTTELNPSGHEFLQQLFDKYDEVSIHTFVAFLQCFHFGFLILKKCFIFYCRTKTLPCLRPNWQIFFESVLTCRGVTEFTCRYPTQLRDTSLTTATIVCGCECLSQLGMILLGWKHVLYILCV